MAAATGSHGERFALDLHLRPIRVEHQLALELQRLRLATALCAELTQVFFVPGARWLIVDGHGGIGLYQCATGQRRQRRCRGKTAALSDLASNVSQQFHADPETYVQRIRAALPGYDELQDQAIEAIPFEPHRVLELGIGTGETARRLLARFPNAQVTGVDASAEMISRARELRVEAYVGRIEEPLPKGPWDLVIGVLTVHHLTVEQKRVLFRDVREQSRCLVLGDQVRAEEHALPPEPGIDFLEEVEDLAVWCDGEIVWSSYDLAVIRAVYG